MAKKSSFGCLGIIVTLIAFAASIFIVVTGFSFWIIYQYNQDPLFLFRKYPALAKSISSVLLKPVNAEQPLPIEDVAFNETAYQNFVQKQGKILDLLQNPNARNVPVEIVFVDTELKAFLLSELAKYEIRKYDIVFQEGGFNLKASAPASVFRPFLPQSLPESMYQIYDTLGFVNCDIAIKFSYDGGIKELELISFDTGEFKFPAMMMPKIREQFANQRGRVQEWLQSRAAEVKFQINSIRFQTAAMTLQGVYN